MLLTSVLQMLLRWKLVALGTLLLPLLLQLRRRLLLPLLLLPLLLLLRLLLPLLLLLRLLLPLLLLPLLLLRCVCCTTTPTYTAAQPRQAVAVTL